MSTLLQDLRYAIRMFAQTPSFTAVAVLSLALGIGANTAIFSVINAVLLLPVPFDDPEKLVLAGLHRERPDGRVQDDVYWSYLYYEEFAASVDVFEQSAAFAPAFVNMTGLADAHRMRVEYVTVDYFRLLGVEPSLGRIFAEDETETPGESPVALLSEGTWKGLFGADPGVLGRTIRLEGIPFQIIGVLPPEFEGLTGGIDLWVPFTMSAPLDNDTYFTNPYWFWHLTVGRLKPGLSMETARAGAAAAAPALAAAFETAEKFTPTLTGLRDAQIDPTVGQPLALLLVAVGFVLLIACANVANLLLSRALARGHEIAIRMAVGAGRGRLLRQFITEGAVLGVAGGAVGLLLGVWTIRLLEPQLPDVASRWTSYGVVGGSVSLDLNVLVFTIVLAVTSGLLFGIAPAWTTRRGDVRSAIATGRLSGPRSSWRGLNARNVLVVAQIGLALLLLVGAGLMFHTLYEMRTAYPGFDGRNVLTARFELSDDRYPEGTAEFYSELLERLRALPGVEAATLSTSLPMRGARYGIYFSIEREDERWDDWSEQRHASMHIVEDDYFEGLGIPLLSGRTFQALDREGTPDVALINRAAAERYWPDRSPVGERVGLSLGRGGREWFEVVGVVENARYQGVEQEVGAEAYISSYQTEPSSMTVFVRTAGSPLDFVLTLREVAASIDAEAPLYDARTLDELGAGSRARTRFITLLLGSFAALALVLSAAGIYGVMAFAVATRTREIGIRKAMGASRGAIFRAVLKEGIALTAAGAAVGAIATGLLTRFIDGYLYEVAALDPVAVTATAATLAAVAVLATYVPAMRAAKADPLVALRGE